MPLPDLAHPRRLLESIMTTFHYSPLRPVCLMAVISFLCARAGRADLIEDFSYSNGNLTAVSGSTWRLWQTGVGDATVTSGTARLTYTTDVIRPFPGVLTATGVTATFSFSINIGTTTNSSEGYIVSFEPASSPFGSANTNYGNSLGIGLYPGTTAGRANITGFEG